MKPLELFVVAMLATFSVEAAPCPELEAAFERWSMVADTAEKCALELERYAEDRAGCREFENAWIEEQRISMEEESRHSPAGPTPDPSSCESSARAMEMRELMDSLNMTTTWIDREVDALSKVAAPGAAPAVFRFGTCEIFWDVYFKSWKVTLEASENCLDSLRAGDSPESSPPCLQYQARMRDGIEMLAYTSRHLPNPKWFGNLCSEKYEESFWSLYDAEKQIVLDLLWLGFSEPASIFEESRL